MELELKTTNVFSRNNDALSDKNIRFIINQGGSRSSKTWSLCQLMIIYALQNKNKVISIVRKSFPSLRGTVMRDFFQVLKELDIYSEKHHNKTEHIYTFPNGTIVEFFSLDDSQKVRGRSRDILWANESNELDFEEFTQLNMRTRGNVFVDFNPSDTEHWLYPLIEREDSILIHSTYKDNPFLNDAIIKEIEELIKTDEDYYNIYALGLPSKSKNTIYNHFNKYKQDVEGGDIILGLDFGYKHPTALILGRFVDDICYTKELIYQSHLTTPDLIALMKTVYNDYNIPMGTTVVCDYARPEIITELNRAGFNCVNAIKNVQEGIDAVKSTQVFIDDNSTNLWKESKNYKWKEVKGVLQDEPVKLWDDALDALRYLVLYHKKHSNTSGGWEFTSFSF